MIITAATPTIQVDGLLWMTRGVAGVGLVAAGGGVSTTTNGVSVPFGSTVSVAVTVVFVPLRLTGLGVSGAGSLIVAIPFFCTKRDI